MKWCCISLSVCMCIWKMSGQRCKVNFLPLFKKMHLLMRCKVNSLTVFR
uniref:Uncharacterized protein n=1 Tax=Arundo donax TaxID=35708 RepID=A0A0A9A880_ARUDO